MKKIFFLIAVFLLVNFAFAKNLVVKFNFPLNSGIEDITQEVSVSDDENAFTAFLEAAKQKSLQPEISFFDFDGDGIKEAAFVNGVNGVNTSEDFSKYWQFSENNKPALVGISQSFPSNGDTVSLDYFEGNVADAVEWLADHQNENGSFGSNLFQSAFALMGLSLAEQNGINLQTTIVSNGINYFLSQQNQQAGFVDDLHSAVAVMALLSNGKELEEFEKNGSDTVELLASHQNADGGFESGTSESDTDTTSWAALAFLQAGKQLPENNGNSPVDFLLSAQHSNGSFGYNASDQTESIEFTEEAIIALSAPVAQETAAVQNALDWLFLKQDEAGCISDGFRTALGSIAFRSFAEQQKANRTLECLLTLQNGDGSFGRTSNPSNALDTGIAVIALSREKFPLTVSPPVMDGNGGL
ncbi:MAG: DUF4430 domain-containing protein, partial [Candidatus Diapherotrites archaeon]|nr:DUF4430 domain-containing protein [Candidatus Diapherotrites archaeon]